MHIVIDAVHTVLTKLAFCNPWQILVAAAIVVATAASCFRSLGSTSIETAAVAQVALVQW